MENNATESKKEKKENEKLDLILKQMQQLAETNAQLQEEINVLKAEKIKQENEKIEHNKVQPLNSDRMVTIIHLYENAPGLETTLLTSDNRPLLFRKYGDCVQVRYFEFASLLSRYYDLFTTNRIFTLGSEDEDIMKESGIPMNNEAILTREEMRNLLSRTPEEVANIYKRVCDTHKQLILSTWQRGYYANEDARYKDINYINALNVASGYKLKTLYENATEHK